MFNNENFSGSSAKSTNMLRFILLFTSSLFSLTNSIQFTQEGPERRLSFSGFCAFSVGYSWVKFEWNLKIGLKAFFRKIASLT